MAATNGAVKAAIGIAVGIRGRGSSRGRGRVREEKDKALDRNRDRGRHVPIGHRGNVRRGRTTPAPRPGIKDRVLRDRSNSREATVRRGIARKGTDRREKVAGIVIAGAVNVGVRVRTVSKAVVTEEVLLPRPQREAFFWCDQGPGWSLADRVVFLLPRQRRETKLGYGDC